MEPPTHGTPYSEHIPCSDLPVLLVDDDRAFRDRLAEKLRADGHPVAVHERLDEIASSGSEAEASAVIAGHENEAELVRFATEMHSRHPHLVFVLVVDELTADLEDQSAFWEFIRVRLRAGNLDELHALAHDLVMLLSPQKRDPRKTGKNRSARPG